MWCGGSVFCVGLLGSQHGRRDTVSKERVMM